MPSPDHLRSILVDAELIEPEEQLLRMPGAGGELVLATHPARPGANRFYVDDEDRVYRMPTSCVTAGDFEMICPTPESREVFRALGPVT